MKENLPDPYWWFFSSNVDDWHKTNKDRDRERFRRIWRDKQERKLLREGRISRL